MDNLVMVPISIGELYDKISILEIKIGNMDSPGKIANVTKEYGLLRKIAEDYPIDTELYKKIGQVNKRIWDIEDGIRECEKEKHFKERFKDLARAVYFNNDLRSEIKKEINLKYGSAIVEEKSYTNYK